MTTTYSIYFQPTGKQAENVTNEANPQGYPVEREAAFLLWWATQDPALFVPAFELYHHAPARCHLEEDRGLLIGIKQVDTGVFEVFKHKG